ncbi:RIP metalloprotease RseP [Nonlabens sp. Asnod3-H03]|uniref:RIP metalloprotease RseP n=1 Tax=Nonlabens sp. Asnod3-H03 TaxID=3160580 RepID=UPI0038696658
MHPYLVIAINFLLSLSLLIVLHELGHFIPARLFKTRVEKFFLFFDIKYSLFKKKIGETEYGIGWLPLGGYVKIAGMIDESMDKEQMAEEPKPWEFRSKPAWQRLIIMLGGVVVNVVVGFFIYIMIFFTYGGQQATGTDYKFGFGMPPVLQEIGFKNGDQVLLVDGDTLQIADNLVNRLVFRDVETVTVIRDGSPVNIGIPEDIGKRVFYADIMGPLEARFPFEVGDVEPGTIADSIGLKEGMTIVEMAGYPISYNTDYTYAINHVVNDSTPFELKIQNENGMVQTKTIDFINNKRRIIGFRKKPTVDYASATQLDYSFGESINKGISHGYWTMQDYVKQFKYVFTKKGASQLGGFGTIAKLYPDTWDWRKFWERTAWISFVLAIMNILPIPALDGGHVMFLLYEMITGRKPGDKFLERAQLIGIFILLALMLYANGNDLYKAISENFF